MKRQKGQRGHKGKEGNHVVRTVGRLITSPTESTVNFCIFYTQFSILERGWGISGLLCNYARSINAKAP